MKCSDANSKARHEEIVAMLRSISTKAELKAHGFKYSLIKDEQFSRLTSCPRCHKPNDGSFRNFSMCKPCRTEKIRENAHARYTADAERIRQRYRDRYAANLEENRAHGVG